MDRSVNHICMADDDPDDYFLFETALKEVSDSVRLTYFSTCDGLLNFLKEDTDLPHLIVLDMNMPGNNGCACLVAIKRQAHLLHIPIIIYSTSSTLQTVKQAYDCGAYKYVIKPPSINGIQALIKELLTAPLDGTKE